MSKKAGNASATGFGTPRVWKPAATDAPPAGGPEFTPEEIPEGHPAPPPGDVAGAAESHGRPVEIGGRSGPEPTRYGDWEKSGRCIDF